ncbi:hypothetical protein [Phocaeicola sartorii]|uniref:hypothetical protein n=1 Tax=Phocaeicola sartorii TaxID=671267 RepID=UPI003F68D50F
MSSRLVISEQQAREIVERMRRRESRSEKSMDDFYRNIGLDPEHLAQPGKTVTKKAETATGPKKWQCHRSVSAANNAGCRWTSTVPLTCKFPR